MMQHHALGLYEKALPEEMSWMQRLETARDLGFDFVEISVDETDARLSRLDWNSAEREKIKAAITQTGVPIRSMCLSCHRRFPYGSADSSIRTKADEIMEKAVILAADLGIRVVQVAGYDVYYEPSNETTRRHFLEGLRKACRWAARHQVMLAMEIMDTPFFNSISTYLTYDAKLQSPWFSVYPDLGNLTAWGNDVSAELEKGISHIVAVHVKETVAVTDTFPGKFKKVPFGTGCVDFVGCFRKLTELKYQGPYLIEMWHQPGADNLKLIRDAKTFVEEQYRMSIEL